MKRAAVDTSTSTNASSSSSSSVSKAPKRKRARLSSPTPAAVNVAVAVGEAVDQGGEDDRAAGSEEKKRKRVPGSLRRLSVPAPRGTKRARTVRRSTLDGSLVATPSKDPKQPTGGAEETTTEVVMVRRKNGRGMGGYLKLCVRAFTERGKRRVEVHAMGAAIDLALRVALATRDALPGGGQDACRLVVKTSTVDVQDLVIPDDDRLEPVNQERAKSAIRLILQLEKGVKFDVRKQPAHSTKRGQSRGKKR